jgi:hypothetical protein
MSDSFDPKAMFGYFQQMMNPAATTFNTLFLGLTDPKEIEKKIADLNAVKVWLTASVATVEMSIKALEFQHSLLDPEAAKRAQDATPHSPAEWAWEMMQKAAAGGVKVAEGAINAAGAAMQAKPKAKRARSSKAAKS